MDKKAVFTQPYSCLLYTSSYKKIALIICIFSFVISNVGLTQLVTVSLPVLMAIYPCLLYTSIALLGIIAVVLVGHEITDLGNLVSKKFSIFLSIVVYLLIGPLFALPRTGSVSYELAVKPYVPSEYSWLVSLGVTAVFFAVTYFLSARPNKIVDIIGKYLTPILILSIVAIFFSCLFMDKSNHAVQYLSLIHI